MRAFFWIGLVVTLLVIQATLVPMLFTGGVRPDLLLVAVVSTGLLFGKEPAIGLGFFAGLLQDLASGTVFGLNILAKMAVGYAFGLAERNIFKENIVLPVLAVMLATLLQSLFMMSFLVVAGYSVNFFAELQYQVLPTLLYNVILAVPVHYVCFCFNRCQVE